MQRKSSMNRCLVVLLLSTSGAMPASASPTPQGAAATDAQIGTATAANIPVTLHGDLAGFRLRTAVHRIEDGVEILTISLSRDTPARHWSECHDVAVKMGIPRMRKIDVTLSVFDQGHLQIN